MKHYDEYGYEEDTRYVKKKESSKSKAKTKSKHKHLYEPCIFVYTDDGTCAKGEYCTICGKIGDVKFGETEENETSGRVWRMPTKEELIEKYPKLPIFILTDIFTKYATITDKLI